MRRILERTILLKSVSFFREIPAEDLSRIARIAEEVRAQPGEIIFQEGAMGESLYIVAEGSIRILKGSTEVARMNTGDCLGEMALLDGSPRSATARAGEESVLLRIAQEAFFEVMGDNPQIMQGVVRLLTRRLRESNEKLMAASVSQQ